MDARVKYHIDNVEIRLIEADACIDMAKRELEHAIHEVSNDGSLSMAECTELLTDLSKLYHTLHGDLVLAPSDLALMEMARPKYQSLFHIKTEK